MYFDEAGRPQLDASGLPKVYTPMPLPERIDNYAVRLVSKLRNDGVLGSGQHQINNVNGLKAVAFKAIGRLLGEAVDSTLYQGPQGDVAIKEFGKYLAQTILIGYDPERKLPSNHAAVNSYLKRVIANAWIDRPFTEHPEIKDKMLLALLEEVAYRSFDLSQIKNNRRGVEAVV